MCSDARDRRNVQRVEHRDPALTLPLLMDNSRFTLHQRTGDTLNFTRPGPSERAG